MIQNIRQFALYLSLSVILLHSFYPHQHYTSFSTGLHAADVSIEIGFLDRLLSVDIGEEHLEHFSSVSNSVLQFYIPIISCVLLISLFRKEILIYFSKNKILTVRQFIQSCLIYRGPPVTA